LQPAPAGSLLEYLQQIPDPRGRQGRRHTFTAMLATIVCAFLQGAQGYFAIAQWIHCQEAKFWHELGYTRRPPKLGAFRKLLMKLPAEQFEQAIRAWVTQFVGDPAAHPMLQPVAMDGKTLRGALQPYGRAMHLLSLLDQATGCTLGQIRVDEQTNEAKAALELLRSLVLKGRIVTGDAMFCQREVCQEVLDHGGHYLFVVKDNQPALKEAITAEFAADFSPGEPAAA
jgi:DDE_Tnp_1-associated/Transposase DDE domain